MEKNEITAQWARKTSQEVLGKKVNEQIDTCLSAIQIAVKKNELECSVSLYVENLTVKELEKRGFIIIKHSAMDQRDTDYITIKW